MNSKVKALVGLVVVAVIATGGVLFLKGPSTQHKVLFIDSYHEGYEWSDGITAGIQQVLAGQNVELKIHRMDTKRNKSEADKQNAALKAKSVIDEFQPDVVIATDDNAQKYLVVPFYLNSDLPFVFAGVNWEASQYGYPASNVTGMIEVDAAAELIDTLRNMSGGVTVGYISSDTVTSEKVLKSYREILGIEFAEVALVPNFETWKQAYVEMQEKVDILYFYNNAGIENWNNDEAARFATENAQVPSGSTQSWMAPYVLLLFTKQATEQGEYAAETALRILEGNSPGDIPLTRNAKVVPFVNAEFSKRLQLDIPAELMSEAAKIM